ncbi:MAG: hypothetical protein ICCCNLDF_03193 [Planctomycetes bacterium]|nr:hypothetical protein [Planctomycetota bacterium]
MEMHLRFGMHRDIQLMHEEKDLYDGFVIPAHILSYQEASTSAFVTSLPDKSYVIDPMTFIFQNPRGTHFNDDDELRPSVRKLCVDYGKELVDSLEGLGTDDTLSAAQVASVPNLAKSIAKFQLDKVPAASATSAAAKYLKRYAKTEYKLPRYVLSPYYFFHDVGDEWYKLSVSSLKTVQSQKLKVPVAGVVAAHVAALTTSGIKTIVEDYSTSECVFIWIDDFNQTQVGRPAIRRLRKLIKAFDEKGVRVELLYGGYIGVMSHFDGLDAISHGILYTTHKSMYLTPGGGGAPERYYIPAFKEFRSLSQTEVIVQKQPELLCDCRVCKEIIRGKPNRFMRLAADPEMLRRHFLAVRRMELDGIEKVKLEGVLKELRTTYEKYDELVSLLPNPDAYMTEGSMQGLGYLDTWADAFDPDVE